jgi:hypothetical protein
MHGIVRERNGGPVGIGLIFSESDFWVKKRAWTVKQLKEHGFGKSSSIDSSTKDEVKVLLQNWESKLDTNGRGIVQVHNAFAVAATKILWKMVVGRLNNDDEYIMKKLLEKSEVVIDSGNFGPGLMMVAPFLNYFVPEWTGYNLTMNLVNYGREVANVSFIDVQGRHVLSNIRLDVPF